MTLPRNSRSKPVSPRPGRLPRLLGLALALALGPEVTQACQYNVRDVGFVDLETHAYHLYLCVRPGAPENLRSWLHELPAAALRDCNITSEILTGGIATDHPAFPHLPHASDGPLATAVLVSPKGRSLPFPLSPRLEAFRESLATALDQIASSPKREELVAAASRSFAAVLLIEGEAAEANRRARQAISLAIETIRGQLPSMPKAIAEAPLMVVFEAAALDRERVLLWSLGLDPATTAAPRAAIVYGRARWVGPLMRGEEIAERNLTGLLSILGADCECGLDVAWTLGTRLPVRWDEARHAQVAKALGFDPESPLVKVEVSRIATRSGSPRTRSVPNPTVVLSSDPLPRSEDGSAQAAAQSDSAGPPLGRTAPQPQRPAADDRAAVLLRVRWFAGVLALIVLATAVGLGWKARRRQAP